MTASLEVAVNLTWLAPGRVGGSEQYLVRQLLGLPDPADLAPTLYCQSTLAAAHPALAARFTHRELPFRRDSRAARIVAEHTWLAHHTRTADLVHHGGGTAPTVGRRPIVLTVHDLQFLQYPQYFSPARRRYLATMMPRSIGRAAVVTAPTEYVRSTVIDAFDADPDRVVVVPHGVPDGDVPAVTVDDVRRRYGLGERPYLVYPAITHPHKRHRILVEMLADLPTDVALVLVGGSGTAEPDLRRSVAASPARDRIVRPGRVDDRDRDALVAGASALVFPSEYEGFGAPLIEAMALDTPIVCGSHPAMREVVGDAAVVVDDPDPAAWASAVTAAIDDRARLVASARLRRRSFTAAASGTALLSAYRMALAT